MHIAIFGLGHVGTTIAACLARDGHHAYGVDPDPAVTRAVAAGRSLVREPGLEALLAAGVAAGRLQAGASALPWADRLEMALICVGTPALPTGDGLDLGQLEAAARELGRLTRGRRPDRARPPLLVVVRSTVPPGTMESLVLPTLEAAVGEAPGRLYELAYNPELLRTGSAIRDHDDPPLVVIGERRPGFSRRLMGLHASTSAPLFEVPFRTAELLKLACNGWHALKVAFANELGRIAQGHGVEPATLSDLFLADPVLNLGPAYLRPGTPFGGSCLPKDLAALQGLAAAAGQSAPLLAATATSNTQHAAWLTRAVVARCPPPGPILLLGLSFKAGTDDLRGSPLLALARTLLAAGYDLAIHDPDLDPARLTDAEGASAHAGPLAAMLTTDLDAALAGAALVVLGKPMPAVTARLPVDTSFVDFTRLEGL